MSTPADHPRHASLTLRERVVEGFQAGLVATQGLIAHGRGEALDYMLGERSHDFAHAACTAAAQMLKTADHPVLSVNGNTAALAAPELVALAQAIGCPLEVNLFHYTPQRAEAIKAHLEFHGAPNVLTQQAGSFLLGLSSDRRLVHPDGILTADVVLVPLEDGDRCEILRQHGKQVIAIDLNPLSRTSRMADISIVDNVVRALVLIKHAYESDTANEIEYNNTEAWTQAEAVLRGSIETKKT